MLTICLFIMSRGTGTPKDKDEVKRREVCECEDCCLTIICFFSNCLLFIINRESES